MKASLNKKPETRNLSLFHAVSLSPGKVDVGKVFKPTPILL